MLRITAKLQLPAVDELLTKCGLDKGGRVQHAINEAVISFSKQGNYVPASPNRILEDSAVANDEDGQVIWNTPYAHYQYMGEVYGPNIPIIDPETGVLMGWFSPPGRPKHPTGEKLTYDKTQNPNAGPFWFERMKADYLNDIIRLAQAAVKGD